MGWSCSQNGGSRSVFKILVSNLTGRPWCRTEDNITIDLEEIVINMWNWVGSAHIRDYMRALVNAALNLRMSKKFKIS